MFLGKFWRGVYGAKSSPSGHRFSCWRIQNDIIPTLLTLWKLIEQMHERNDLCQHVKYISTFTTSRWDITTFRYVWCLMLCKGRTLGMVWRGCLRFGELKPKVAKIFVTVNNNLESWKGQKRHAAHWMFKGRMFPDERANSFINDGLDNIWTVRVGSEQRKDVFCSNPDRCCSPGRAGPCGGVFLWGWVLIKLSVLEMGVNMCGSPRI